MDRFLYLSGELDLKKLSNICNFKNCEIPPSKEVLVKEYNIRKDSTRSAVSLYFCTEHIKEIAPIIERFNRLSAGKIITTEIKETGIITY